MFGRVTIMLGTGPHFLFFFSSPNFSGRRLDVYHTSTNDVALARIQNACPKCAARGSLKYRTQKSPFWHHRTTLLGHIFAAIGMYRQSEKNLLNIDTSSSCPHNMVNFGLLTAVICWRVWGTPANFSEFRVLAASLHDTLVVGVSQTAALNRGRHLYSAGRPSRWSLTHILVHTLNSCSLCSRHRGSNSVFSSDIV